MKERWAFSALELADPTKCTSYDELVAIVDTDSEWDDVDSYGIVVYRNGKISNRFDDGTYGVPVWLTKLADDVESLLHPDGEETAVWKDVEVDDDGKFTQFSGK